MKTFRKILRILGTVLLVFLLAVVIVIFNARINGEAPNVFGYQIYIVSSDSMEPKLMVDDVILVKQTEITNIQKGDIITYIGEEADLRGKYITHQVVEAPKKNGNRYELVTCGIKPGAMNDPVIYDDQVLGVYLRTIPHINKIYSFFLQPYGIIVFIFIIVALFGYEIIALIVSYKSLDYYDEDENEDEKSEKKRKKFKSDSPESSEFNDQKSEAQQSNEE